MKIAKGHYVPKELITSEAVHEAVVKVFVDAGFKDKRPDMGDYKDLHEFDCVYTHEDLDIALGEIGLFAKKPLTLQQLFTAENGLVWPDWADCIDTDGKAVWFHGRRGHELIAGEIGTGPVVMTLATRQPKEKEVKNEAIEKSVIQFNGVWPDHGHTHIIYRPDQTGIHAPFWVSSNPEWHNDYISFSRQEFEAEAKRLGYINGYRWGVEYPTNGKRPELADDVLVLVKNHSKESDAFGSDPVKTFLWEHVSSFKITDPRYKPADTSYLQTPAVETVEEVEQGDWWNYETNKRTASPPIGQKLLFDDSGVMTESVILYIGKEKMLANISDGSDTEYCMGVASLDFYYPLDHATRKAELERNELKHKIKYVVCKSGMITADGTESERIANELIDAGWRPTK